MSRGKYDSESSIELLKNKQKELSDKGFSRYPQRPDFTDEEVVAIKAFLGPWPRALEAAGLKSRRDCTRHSRSVEKRVRSKRLRTKAMKASEENKSAGLPNPDKPEK